MSGGRVGRDLVGGESAVDAVRRDVLAGFEPKRFVVERDGDLVRFEGQVIAYPGDLGPGVAASDRRPRSPACARSATGYRRSSEGWEAPDALS